MMDMLDHALESSHDKDGEDDSCEADEEIDCKPIPTPSITIVEGDSDEPGSNVAALPDGASLVDPTTGVHYHLATEGGTRVAYRLFQVSPNVGGGDSPTIEGIPSITTGSGLSQAILSTSLSNSNSSNEGAGDTRFTYIPSVSNNENHDSSSVTVSRTGPFYVIDPHEVFNAGQRSIAPRVAGQSYDGGKIGVVRDERRRATHNEVERRRRDKINNWITKLSKVIPDCLHDQTKQGQSKGGILAKACDYITDLHNSNIRLSEKVKELERQLSEIDSLRLQNEELKTENAMLKVHLHQERIGNS